MVPVLLFLASVTHAGPEMIPEEAFRAATQPRSDPRAEGIELPLRDGTTFRLSDHQGQPVLLSFWASWCGPCRAELPALEVWAAQNPRVTVVTVNVDRSIEPAERFMASVRFDLPVAFDPDSAQLGRYGVVSMPTMFLFDRQGALAWQHTGYGTESGFTELDAAVGGLL